MNSQNESQGSMLAIGHTDTNFEHKSIYLSGQSFVRCRFHSCTLIIKDMAMLCVFEDCSFENCVCYLNMTIMHRQEWQHFLTQVVPAISAALPENQP